MLVLFLKVVAAFIVVVAVIPGSSAGAAPDDRPTLTVRVFGGVPNGLSLGFASASRMISIDATQSFMTNYSSRNTSLSEVALGARTRGSTGWWAGARVGYLLERTVYDANAGDPDLSHTVDVSAALGATSHSGNSFLVEGGVESVIRGAAYECCDSVAPAFSLGLRALLGGDVAIARHVAVFGRAGIRTGFHLFEIRVMPLLYGGVAVTF